MKVKKVKGYTLELVETLKGMNRGKFLATISEILKEREAEELSIVIAGLEIMQTISAFSDNDSTKLIPLKEALELNPFSFYLEEMGVESRDAKRENLISWWSTLMQLAGTMGYNVSGIDSISRNTNLWKATAALASKMHLQPATYRYLPPFLANYPSEVNRVLGEISEPVPFIEILVGETFEDMSNFHQLIGALSTIRRDGKISRSVADGVFSVHMILQRG